MSLVFFQNIQAQVDDSQSEEEEEEEEEYYEDDFQFDNVMFVGLNFQLGIPQSNFGNNVDYVGWGFGGNIIKQVRDGSPLYAGVDFGYLNFDRERDVTLNSFNENIETETKNTIVTAHLLLRFYPEVNFFIEPYFEGLFGMKSIFTRTVLTDISNGNETLNSQFDESDFAISYGAAIGVEIPVIKEYLSIDLRCAFQKGAVAEYYTRIEDAVNTQIPLDAFELKNSNTDLLVPQIGVTFMIGMGQQDDEDYYEEDY